MGSSGGTATRVAVVPLCSLSFSKPMETPRGAGGAAPSLFEGERGEMITKTKQVVVQAVGQALRALATKKSDGAATWPQEISAKEIAKRIAGSLIIFKQGEADLPTVARSHNA